MVNLQIAKQSYNRLSLCRTEKGYRPRPTHDDLLGQTQTKTISMLGEWRILPAGGKQEFSYQRVSYIE
jgi:hypothetical protein